MRKFIYVHIIGQGINKCLKCYSHEVKAYPANTYHVFEMPNGAFLWMNDFGIQSILVADSQEKLHE